MGASRYEVFCKVVELGSLTQAAEVLGYTQPGISHIISAMEEEFGFPVYSVVDVYDIIEYLEEDEANAENVQRIRNYLSINGAK